MEGLSLHVGHGHGACNLMGPYSCSGIATSGVGWCLGAGIIGALMEARHKLGVYEKGGGPRVDVLSRVIALMRRLSQILPEE